MAGNVDEQVSAIAPHGGRGEETKLTIENDIDYKKTFHEKLRIKVRSGGFGSCSELSVA